MQDALKRLRALQQELESLHRTTAKVLAESEQLIGQLETPSPDTHPAPVPAPSTPRRKRVRAAQKPATKRTR